MKKTYNNPKTTIVNIKTQQLLTVSGEFGDGQKPGNLAASRRGRSLWDDEEEEDF